MDDRNQILEVENADIKKKLEAALAKVEKLEFTEKERDQLISEKYYLLDELHKYSVR